MQYQRPVVAQQQKLKLTPQLYNSIQMMSLPLQELRLRIYEEVEKNPSLEIVDDGRTLSLDATEDRSEDYSLFENSSDPGFQPKSSNPKDGDGKQLFLEGVLVRSESLQEHLLQQFRLYQLHPSVHAIGELLIQNLDENGFHREAPESFLTTEQLGLLPEAIEIVQGLDPVGCATSDYKSSLLAQWSRDPIGPEGMDRIILEHLPLVKAGKVVELSRRIKCSTERVDELIRYLKTLNPYPGSSFSAGEVSYVIPDLTVRKVEGQLTIILNEEEIPEVRINAFFNNLSSGVKEKRRGRDTEEESARFAAEKVREARWFIDTIHRRNITLLKIAKIILDHQREFFIKGPKYLLPLTLKDVAEQIDVHETTVSRIANKKYVQTEWGIYPVRHFFTNSISGSGSGGSRHSKEGVKEIIKEIINDNRGNGKISDQKIANILGERGIPIARRTVAKYRGELDEAEVRGKF